MRSFQPSHVAGRNTEQKHRMWSQRWKQADILSFAVTKNREATVADLFTIVVVVVVLFLALGLHLC